MTDRRAAQPSTPDDPSRWPPRERLVAWRRALGQEGHHLVTRPDLLWPLLHNRLQWEPEEVSGPALASELARHPGAWLRTRTPPQESGALLLTLVGHEAIVNACAVAPDGTWIASAGWDGTVRTWDAVSGRETACLVGHGHPTVSSLLRRPVNACAISPDGSWIVSASDDATLRIWDVPAATERARLTGHRGTVNRCAVSPDGTWIVSAGEDGSLRIWDVETATERAVLEGHSDAVNDCAVSPDGTWVASVSDDGTLRTWEVATGQERSTLVEGTRHVHGCAISADGTWIAASGFARVYGDGPPPWPCLSIWDASTGARLTVLEGEAETVYRCAVSPDGASLATVAWDDGVDLWDVPSARAVGSASGHTGGVEDVAISPDGARLVSASADGTLKVWNLPALLTGSGSGPRDVGDMAACAMAPDGTWVAAVTRSGHAGIWDTTTGQETVALVDDGSFRPFDACAVAPDGSFVVSASQGTTTVLLWDPRTGAVLGRLAGNEWANDCAVAPDGSYVLTASGYFALRLWDAQTGLELRKLEPRWYRSPADTTGLSACAVAPDGSFVVAAGPHGAMQLWDPTTGEEAGRAGPHDEGVTSIAVAPDASYLVSAGWDHRLRVWDRVTGAERARMEGHAEAVMDCAVSPDGSFVASVSRDRTIRLWDPATGAELCQLPTSAELTSVSVGPGGGPIACAGEGSFLTVLDVVGLGR